ncbi:MAG: AbrB/MazE/SpoVT family DNA-binding domain-containing protein [Ruminococcaceae bacterium]|nr:AbrB/MazE/SpoVT family DNA-binding domain-containing protein [Oscillospiraceae bacterium]
MKSTGMVRKLDDLGRIVLPKEIRNTLGINEKDPVEIFMDGDRIVLQKYHPACVFCNNVDNVTYFNGKRVCSACIEKIKSQL